MDAAGNVYVLTTGPSHNMSSITKLSPGGDILYSKALEVQAAAIAADPAGNAYVTGTAGTGFATTAGAYQPQLGGGTCHGGAGVGISQFPCPDAFVLKLRTHGSIAYATFLGGSAQDQGRAIAVDTQGNAWTTGDTVSHDFPATTGALQSKFGGETVLGPLSFGDAFVAKLDPTGSKLLYSTYLGGAAPDAGFAIAVDGAGAAYVAGGTQSTDFPTTPGALQRAYGGGSYIPALAGDAFVAKFSPSGIVSYATYLGGPQDEAATMIRVDSHGDAFVNAYPNTSTQNVKTLSVLNPDGSAIVRSLKIYPSPCHPGSPISSTPRDYDPALPHSIPCSMLRPARLSRSSAVVSNRATRVFFDGVSAPIVDAQLNQIKAVVPFEVTLGPGTMDVFDAVPALFTLNRQRSGGNSERRWNRNSPANPAARGSVISAFMPGACRMTPPQADGSLGPLSAPFAVPVMGVGCSIGQVLYAGAAPCLVAGSVRVNIRIVENVMPGDKVPIVVYVGSYASGFYGDTTLRSVKQLAFQYRRAYPSVISCEQESWTPACYEMQPGSWADPRPSRCILARSR